MDKTLLAERIESKIERIPESGCWIWMGPTMWKGYGHITIDNKSYRTHRIMWEIHNGSIPKNLFVLHSCDTPSCINPNHLFLGTHQDNMKDCTLKNRHKNNPQLGIANPKAKLTEQDIPKIREDKRNLRFIAKEYGVSCTTISDIKHRKFWRHIP